MAKLLSLATISAECHSDDYVINVVFDATPWFIQATDEKIIALAGCNWGGDYPADEVAVFMQDQNKDIDVMFSHIYNFNKLDRWIIGFECHVDGDAALAWLRINRPAIVALLPQPVMLK